MGQDTSRLMTFEEAKGTLNLDEFTCLTRAYKMLTHPVEEDAEGDSGGEASEEGEKSTEDVIAAFPERLHSVYRIDPYLGRALLNVASGGACARESRIMTYPEFVCAIATACRAVDEQRIWFWFKMWDVCNNGSLTSDEVHAGLSAVARTAHSARVDIFSIGKSLTEIVRLASGADCKQLEQLSVEEQQEFIGVTHGELSEAALRLTVNAFKRAGRSDAPQLTFKLFHEWIARHPTVCSYLPHILAPLTGAAFVDNSVRYFIPPVWFEEWASAVILMLLQELMAEPLLPMGYASKLLSPIDRCILRSWVIPHIRASRLALLFSCARHGFSASSLISYSFGERPHNVNSTFSLLIVKDNGGNVFGAFIASVWRKNSERFHGEDNRNFLFRLHPAPAEKYAVAPNTTQHLWSGSDGLGIGGRENYFGLFLDSSLMNGSSRKCSTFHSSSLSSEEEFTIAEVEVWGFVEDSHVEEYELELEQREEDDDKKEKKQKDNTYILDLIGRSYNRDR